MNAEERLLKYGTPLLESVCRVAIGFNLLAVAASIYLGQPYVLEHGLPLLICVAMLFLLVRGRHRIAELDAELDVERARAVRRAEALRADPTERPPPDAS